MYLGLRPERVKSTGRSSSGPRANDLACRFASSAETATVFDLPQCVIRWTCESTSKLPKGAPMKAKDIMTHNVATIAPDVSVQEIAELMLSRRVSGVPVVDGHGHLIGIVSEGDLMRR